MELAENPDAGITWITAPPRMKLYEEYSTRIFGIYMKYISSEDIHVYSIDEVFMDVTGYLKTYGKSARALAGQIIQNVLRETGITATAGGIAAAILFGYLFALLAKPKTKM